MDARRLRRALVHFDGDSVGKLSALRDRVTVMLLEGDGGGDTSPGRLNVLLDLASLKSLSFSLVAEESSARLVLLWLKKRLSPL